MNEWISVKDRLPEYKKNVFLHIPKYTGRPVREGHLSSTDGAGHKWVGADGYIYSDTTHWMPLPEPPKDTK